MAELKPCPCPLCGSRLKKKKTVRGEIVYDHPLNGCKEECTRVRVYSVDDWNRRADNDIEKGSRRKCPYYRRECENSCLCDMNTEHVINVFIIEDGDNLPSGSNGDICLCLQSYQPPKDRDR